MDLYVLFIQTFESEFTLEDLSHGVDALDIGCDHGGPPPLLLLSRHDRWVIRPKESSADLRDGRGNLTRL
jgi:hypothetical protein